MGARIREIVPRSSPRRVSIRLGDVALAGEPMIFRSGSITSENKHWPRTWRMVVR